jgi:hypothetical protein
VRWVGRRQRRRRGRGVEIGGNEIGNGRGRGVEVRTKSIAS